MCFASNCILACKKDFSKKRTRKNRNSLVYGILTKLHFKKYCSLEESTCQLLEITENRGYNYPICEMSNRHLHAVIETEITKGAI